MVTKIVTITCYGDIVFRFLLVATAFAALIHYGLSRNKKLLEEILEDTSDFYLQDPILDGIKHLEYIIKGLQNPQAVQESNPDIQTTQLHQIQLEIAKINAKVDHFFENPNPPRKPTYAEVLQNQQIGALVLHPGIPCC